MTPWTAASQASLSITNSWSLLKLISIESVMPFNPLMLGKIEGRRRGWQRMRWLDGIISNWTNEMMDILAWKIPWVEEPGRLQSMGSGRVGYDWATSLSLFTFMHWRRKWQPTPVFLPGESQGRGSWWAAVYGVAQSRTQLKWLSSSSSSSHQVAKVLEFQLQHQSF